jgi:polysaccharide pyruvyl transferase WcaK-like protein
MRILIDNSGYELLNLGDVAMLQVAIERLRNFWPQARITVLTISPAELRNCCPGTIPLDPAGRDWWLRRCDLLGVFRKILPRANNRITAIESRAKRRFPRLIRAVADERMRYRGTDSRPMSQFLDAVFDADLVIGTGGGYLTDSFAEHAMDVLETLHLASSLGIPTALLGQGIGPATQERVTSALDRVLPHVDLLTLRESLTSRPIALAHGARESRVRVTGDDAIEPAYNARPADLGNGLGINIRTAWYARFPEDAVKALRQSITDISSRTKATIVPLPVSAHDGGEDHRAIADLTQGLVHNFDESLDTPMQLIRRVGTCRTIITGSYHAAVFALAQGIPAIGLAQSEYYVNKFLGLAEQFQTGCVVMRMDDPLLRDRLSETALKLWNQAPQLRPALLESARTQIAAGQAAYRLLQELHRERRKRHGRPAPLRSDARL